jgi:hypothetical protein
MSKTKILPDLPHNIMSPDADMPILDFYRGFYDCVYLILHPFLSVTDPKKIDLEKIGPGAWPTKDEIVQFTEEVSWDHFLEISGIKNKNELDIALRNRILGLADKHKNDADLSLLNHALKANGLIAPQEGFFNEILRDNMLKTLLGLGHYWIFDGDEFGFERKLIFIEDVIDNVAANLFYKNWYTPQNEILYTTHWDSHFTILCSTKQNVEKILQKFPFEGFYCNSKTEVYWSIASPISS